MITSAAEHGCRRRSGRFFGFRGVVRRKRRSGASERRLLGEPGSVVTPATPTAAVRATPAAQANPAVQSERARFAGRLDAELRLACRSEAMMRRELGCVARELIRRRSYQRLGFVRLKDYARERLGVSGRTLQCAAWLAGRLGALPAVSRAYDRSELSWAQAREICRVAVAADEARWLALARGSTVEMLERLVAHARKPDGIAADPEGAPDEIDGEPAVRWRFACPARVRVLWRRALELASRAAGEPLAEWRAAEIVAAEGSSGRPTGTSLGDRALIAAIRLARGVRRKARAKAHTADASAGEDRSATVAVAAAGDSPNPDPPRLARDRDTLSLEPPAPSDPFALDARLGEAMRVLRTIEPRIGRLLRGVVDQRIHRSFGYRAFDDYVRERLGLSARKAWALLKIEKATLRSPDFDRAYREGRMSWVRALSLLPVLDRTTAPAWIARAESVTVRRLSDEVEWVLSARDALGPNVSLAPPPMDSPLPSPFSVTSPDECRDSSPPAQLQIRAREDGAAMPCAAERQSATERQKMLEVADAEIRFTGPASVVALLRDVLDAFGDPEEPRWRALERLLRHVIAHWESTPRHSDPVFARDGWRCTVPACSSRRNLHDHHIRFRSRGGDNRRDNRTTVCAAHHLHGIHDGTIQASGVAPHAIEWRLGLRPGMPPFLTYVGDRYCALGAPVAAQVDGLG